MGKIVENQVTYHKKEELVKMLERLIKEVNNNNIGGMTLTNKDTYATYNEDGESRVVSLGFNLSVSFSHKKLYENESS